MPRWHQARFSKNGTAIYQHNGHLHLSEYTSVVPEIARGQDQQAGTAGEGVGLLAAVVTTASARCSTPPSGKQAAKPVAVVRSLADRPGGDQSGR